MDVLNNNFLISTLPTIEYFAYLNRIVGWLFGFVIMTQAAGQVSTKILSQEMC